MIILDERLKYLCKEFFDWKIFIIVTLIAIIISVIIAFIIVAREDLLDIGEKILISSVFVILVGGVLGAGIGAVSATDIRCVASKRQYEIYLTDMTFEELVDSPDYTIVDTAGKKILIEDKEWKYFEGYEE